LTLSNAHAGVNCASGPMRRWYWFGNCCSCGGIGEQSAWVFVTELFAWRRFRNRREVGGITGMVGTPYRSGLLNHEQGISKAGNKRSAPWPRKLLGVGSRINDRVR
jgi:hypothetical protein